MCKRLLSPRVRHSREEPPHSVITRGLLLEELRSAVARSLDAELTHAVAKRVWMKVQDPRRALWTINHSTGILQRVEDMVSVYLFKREEGVGRLEVRPLHRSIRLRSLHAFRGGGDWHEVAVQP